MIKAIGSRGIDNSLSKSLINIEKDNIVVEAVKKVEDDNCIIFRLYKAPI